MKNALAVQPRAAQGGPRHRGSCAERRRDRAAAGGAEAGAAGAGAGARGAASSAVGGAPRTAAETAAGAEPRGLRLLLRHRPGDRPSRSQSARGQSRWDEPLDPAHPVPVILVHGTAGGAQTNWGTYVPLLTDAGYAVFTLTYGAVEHANWPISALGGMRRIEVSAAEFGEFVEKVLAATGADQVDVVGHSQGTLIPNYWARFLGGEGKIRKYISLAPLWQGTAALGRDQARDGDPAEPVGRRSVAGDAVRSTAADDGRLPLHRGDEPGRPPLSARHRVHQHLRQFAARHGRRARIHHTVRQHTATAAVRLTYRRPSLTPACRDPDSGSPPRAPCARRQQGRDTRDERSGDELCAGVRNESGDRTAIR
ncbi:esterase/lipase family protein [Gordonia alkaliphila]|uniref:esterase/lipase family protein n=1 Tax=Gordonia alkaliphila TaxID=1053547 RepID=UPI0031EBCB3A